MNILIADDEKHMLKILEAYFKREGFNTFVAEDGEMALEIFHSNKIDIAVLDWMMPKISGIEACRYIKENSTAKVLILTAKSQNDDEIEALNCGADEYIKKPFDPRILLLRAKKLVNFNEKITVNDIKLNINEQKVYKNNKILKLTKIEYNLLLVFIKNKGIILSRDKLIDLVWGIDYIGDYRTVDTHIRRLRAKIGEDNIKTYRGIGYSLEVDEN
ncbi:response regulator transcription factor [Clostridium botulinum]|uniref:Stage 0 sporulation protein A homolog n=1 Tax=Clostridium botulinum TaxID=1491 RepID=A0A6B4JM39_CLOBO|nr:response regulator transcription factor [Clostridium botulinum]EES47803.1 two-component response regulator [Clostridium botulinum E1 str. 'BoNT E Beluga']MBY6761022.1 response regulator transcription factor [Clostridium botulinum]MBY6919686.1 response regulator transcription factor [Clostridium botulinum]MCR1130814.1 response regulator transcription factor [Clostridium botulinum]NFJ57705.1 response regulator transcription factor [Clostridium botulinum]